MKTHLSWPMPTPVDHLDEVGVLPAKIVDLQQPLAPFLDQCELQVDRAGGKGFIVLTFDTTPGYTDTTPFPAALTKWKYRDIYRVDDHQVGQWSAEVSVNVGG